MMLTTLAVTSLVLAAVPAAVMLKNLTLYRPLAAPSRKRQRPKLSVLIPARNEAANIGPALTSVLSNTGVDLEVLVLDDASDDGTDAIVAAWVINVISDDIERYKRHQKTIVKDDEQDFSFHLS